MPIKFYEFQNEDDDQKKINHYNFLYIMTFQLHMTIPVIKT